MGTYKITGHTQHRIAIGKRIAQLRQERGLSVMQLAGLCNVSRQNIYKIENGRYNVSIDILQKVCNALNVELAIVDKAAE